MPFPDIDPIIFSIGSFALRWYALAYIVGLLGGWWYARWLCSRDAFWSATQTRPTALQIDDLILWVALGVVLGGRTGYVLFYNFSYYLAHPVEIFAVWKGGMSFHGGLAGAALAVVLFARRINVNPLNLLDVVAVVAPLGLGLGRVANFINSELWGRIAVDVPWAVVFPNGGDLPRHPSQLYEALSEGLFLLIVMIVFVRIIGFKRPGMLTGIFALGYALARTVCEFFREPDPQLGFLLGTNVLTMGMILSVPLALGGLYLMMRGLRQEPS
jgi:phosphatidylglycerol:prolipoprotein diacylglycerol transferase